jgi:hypothetical protein
MILSNIIVVLILQNSLQVGVVEGIDFKGRLRTEFKNSSESTGALDDWIQRALADKSQPKSFCVVEPNEADEFVLSDHLRKRLIAREDQGFLDIMSTPENVARFYKKKTANDVNFVEVSGYCSTTIVNQSTK